MILAVMHWGVHMSMGLDANIFKLSVYYHNIAQTSVAQGKRPVCIWDRMNSV